MKEITHYELNDTTFLFKHECGYTTSSHFHDLDCCPKCNKYIFEEFQKAIDEYHDNFWKVANQKRLEFDADLCKEKKIVPETMITIKASDLIDAIISARATEKANSRPLKSVINCFESILDKRFLNTSSEKTI